MSEYYLKLIPEEPAFIPNNDSQLIAAKFMKSLFNDDCDIQFEVSEEIKFVDSGTNFENISCPSCQNEIANTWWSTAMEEAHQTHFSHLEIEVPCCKSKITLNNLQYHFPQGFAKFILTAKNPNVSAFNKQSCSRLEEILGCKLRTIWAHY